MLALFRLRREVREPGPVRSSFRACRCRNLVTQCRDLLTMSGESRRLAGRHIIITGAASGIGRAIAELFSQEGARLGLIDRDADGLAAVSAKLNALALPLDLSESESIPPTVERAARELGRLDGVVNCAALGSPMSIEETDLPLLSRFIAVNLTAPYVLCRAALPHLREAESATIVNIASGQALLPTANNTAYAATKGGLVALSKSLAAEVAPRVRVNALCPGVTNTPMVAPLFAGYDNPSQVPWVQQYALKRVAEPIEIARAALFLTSAESSFVTGVALAVDGGRTFH
jgi:NAD(P)-dependent dehydrogenase (short-subunit alcohol dehydrogenase family)